MRRRTKFLLAGGAAAGVWGAGLLWASATNRPHVYNVPWTGPLVFKKLVIYLTALATSALSIGTFYARYQRTGYMTLG